MADKRKHFTRIEKLPPAQNKGDTVTVKPSRFTLDFRLFMAGFTVSILFMLLIGGFSLVNFHAFRSGRPDYSPLFETKNTYLEYTVSILGRSLYLDKGVLSDITPSLERLSVLLPDGARQLLIGINETEKAMLRFLNGEP